VASPETKTCLTGRFESVSGQKRLKAAQTLARRLDIPLINPASPPFPPENCESLILFGGDGTVRWAIDMLLNRSKETETAFTLALAGGGTANFVRHELTRNDYFVEPEELSDLKKVTKKSKTFSPLLVETPNGQKTVSCLAVFPDPFVSHLFRNLEALRQKLPSWPAHVLATLLSLPHLRNNEITWFSPPFSLWNGTSESPQVTKHTIIGHPLQTLPKVSQFFFHRLQGKITPIELISVQKHQEHIFTLTQPHLCLDGDTIPSTPGPHRLSLSLSTVQLLALTINQ